MQFILNFLIWSPDPDIFTIPILDHPVRWYGLLFAGGFILSQQVMFWIFKREGFPEKDVEKLTVYMVAATVIGARLGHCLFYNPVHYLSNPLEILKVWEGGLASHGGAIGLILAIYLFSRKYPQYSMLWTADRLVIVVALTGAMIRTGNFFNSEMEGQMTGTNTGVVYARFTEDVLSYDERRVDEVEFVKGGELTSDQPDLVPITARVIYKPGIELMDTDREFFESNLRRALLGYTEIRQHIDFGAEEPLKYQIKEENGVNVLEIYGLGKVRYPAQLYEAFYCVLLMLFHFFIWKTKRAQLPMGFNFGLFMFLLWTLRFFDEFLKMNQEAFEEDLLLNMGQILSIPMALFGLILMLYQYRNSKLTMAGTPREVH